MYLLYVILSDKMKEKKKKERKKGKEFDAMLLPSYNNKNNSYPRQ